MPDELASSHQSFIDGFVSKTDTNRKEVKWFRVKFSPTVVAGFEEEEFIHGLQGSSADQRSIEKERWEHYFGTLEMSNNNCRIDNLGGAHCKSHL